MRASEDLVLRRARDSDRPLVAALLSRAHWRHFHLDWRDPLDLLPKEPNLLAFAGGRPVAYLAAPPDPDGTGWIRSFCVDGGLSPLLAWRSLWAEAAAQCLALQVDRVGSLLSGEWMRPLLVEAGFRESNAVVFFEWRRAADLPRPTNEAGLRPLQPADLPQIVDVDGRSFAPLWRNSLESLSAAMSQAIVATGIERNGRLAAYQLTTASPFGAHLARLAVDPDHQRNGLATALVVDLISRLGRRGFDSVTLNTQADNRRSQDLYRKLGFRETGQRYPVFETTLTGGE
ncbi:MAG TPA: GNAT family N-acetyltransferase [Anaerolineales bacterium]|nr:GNAT family N-acetyltransferase [Anaerolineales bacterium]